MPRITRQASGYHSDELVIENLASSHFNPISKAVKYERYHRISVMQSSRQDDLALVPSARRPKIQRVAAGVTSFDARLPNRLDNNCFFSENPEDSMHFGGNADNLQDVAAKNHVSIMYSPHSIEVRMLRSTSTRVPSANPPAVLFLGPISPGQKCWSHYTWRS